MEIVEADLVPYRLAFTTPRQSATGSLMARHGLLLRLTDRTGAQGHGDAAPLPELGSESLEQSEQWLRDRLSRLTGQTASAALANLPPDGNAPAARCCLESALLVLHSKHRGLPLGRLLHDGPAEPVRVNANIGPLDDQIWRRADAAIRAGFTTLKLKMGLASVSDELAQLHQLCGQLPSGVRLRLDANGAWRAAQAQAIIEQLNGLPIESLEEPLTRTDSQPARLRQLQRLAHFDLALDESLTDHLNGRRLSEIPVRRIVLKPTLLGGLLPSLALMKQARSQGVHCLVTSSLESSAGIWPLCHLAAAADRLYDPAVHGLATSDWLQDNLGPPPSIRQGAIDTGERPGSGFSPTQQRA